MNIDLMGVYCIVNKINGKSYIGSTSISFRKRFNHHRNLLKRNLHKNSHLQRAWNLYGVENFDFNILEVIDNVEMVLDREQYWIDSFDFSKLYNINKLASGGCQFSREAIDKRAKTMKSKYKVTREIYKKWKLGELSDSDVGSNIGMFKVWSNPWNKGISFESTEHLKVPKKKKGDRSKDIETKRNKLPEVEVYSIDGKLLRVFRSSRDLEEWSLSNDNDLPIISRFKKPRMGNDVRVLKSTNINKACTTNMPYKNLLFKFKYSPDQQ